MTTWNNTQEGVNISNAWDALVKMYLTWIPQHKTSLQNLANRPIGG